MQNFFGMNFIISHFFFQNAVQNAESFVVFIMSLQEYRQGKFPALFRVSQFNISRKCFSCHQLCVSWPSEADTLPSTA